MNKRKVWVIEVQVPSGNWHATDETNRKRGALVGKLAAGRLVGATVRAVLYVPKTGPEPVKP